MLTLCFDGARLHLIDFGAAREYPEAFVSEYIKMVRHFHIPCIIKTRRNYIIGASWPAMGTAANVVLAHEFVDSLLLADLDAVSV